MGGTSEKNTLYHYQGSVDFNILGNNFEGASNRPWDSAPLGPQTGEDQGDGLVSIPVYFNSRSAWYKWVLTTNFSTWRTKTHKLGESPMVILNEVINDKDNSIPLMGCSDVDASSSRAQVVTKWSVDSGCHKLSENIWFAWSNTYYKGEKVRCHACDTQTNRQTDRQTDMWK